MLFFSSAPHSSSDFSSPTRDRTHSPCNGSALSFSGCVNALAEALGSSPCHVGVFSLQCIDTLVAVLGLSSWGRRP